MPRNQVAKRRTGRATSYAWDRYYKAESSLKRLRAKTRDSKVPNALMASGAVLAGTATAGFINGYGYEQVMGVDSDIALGIGAIALGVATGKPTPIYFGTGCLTHAVGTWADEKGEELANAA